MPNFPDLDGDGATRHYVVLYDPSGKVAHIHQHFQFDGKAIDVNAVETEAKRIALTLKPNQPANLAVLHAVELPKISNTEAMHVDINNRKLTVMPRIISPTAP